jgi:hypothetical protein
MPAGRDAVMPNHSPTKRYALNDQLSTLAAILLYFRDWRKAMEELIDLVILSPLLYVLYVFFWVDWIDLGIGL